MISGVIKTESGAVMVFDEDGNQMPEYQGEYSEVKGKILRDAPLTATFGHVASGIVAVKRDEW